MKLVVEFAVPDIDPSQTAYRRVDVNTDGWEFTVVQPDGELFFRTKMSGNLTVTGDDFIWLDTQKQRFPCCGEVTMNVLKPDCGDGLDSLLFPGYFKLDQVRWDYTECKAEVREIKTRDGYDALYKVWEKPVDLFKATAYSNVPERVPFMAAYVDFFIYEPNENGYTAKTPDGNERGTGRSFLEHIYSRGMPLLSVLSKLVLDTCSGTKAKPLAQTIRSDFYSADIDPVTGKRAGQKIIMAGSDAKRPASIKPASILEVTLKELLDDLKALHNVYWLIDPDSGRLRLEHYSWFAERTYAPLNRVSFNLKKYPEALAKANNESTDLEGLYGYEELVIEGNTDELFAGSRRGCVEYNNDCVIRDDEGVVRKNTITSAKIWTDLYGGYRFPDSVSDDSLFLCEIFPKSPTSEYVSNLPMLAYLEPDEYPGVDISLGATQAASVLFANYHRHGRSFTSGVVNKMKKRDGSYSPGKSMAMLSVKPSKRQEGIEIPVCCEDLPLNLNGYLKTNRFDLCQLGQARFKPGADTFTIDVLATSRCTVTIVVPPDPGPLCPDKGTLLDTRTEQTYCDQNDRQEIVATNMYVYTFADGDCGTYEENGPTEVLNYCR